MATFKINESDSSRVMYDKLNEYRIALKKEKYNNVLKLLNELFDQNNKSLRNFVKIDCNYFESVSISKLLKILENNKEKLGYDLTKLKEYYSEKKSLKINVKDASKNLELKEIKEIKEKESNNKETQNSKIKSKTTSKSEDFSVSKEIFGIISKLIKLLDYKLVKSMNGGKPSYSLIMIE